MSRKPPSTLPSQRHLFDIPDDVSYLNCAYMGPLMQAVVEAGERGIRSKARPWSIAPNDFFSAGERARNLFARIVGADSDGVALVPSASYGLSCAARNLRLKPSDRIVILADQFPSNVYVWRELARTSGAELITVTAPADHDWSHALLGVIDERTAVVAVPHCHWTDGGFIDLPQIGARCRNTESVLVLDLTQSAGALRFDAATVRPDYIVCAGYKWLLGPYSLGFLWVAPQHRDGQPIEYNWSTRAGSDDFTRLVDYSDEYRPGARRFDVGEHANFALLPMVNAALEQILEWGVATIENTLAARNADIARRANNLGLKTLPNRFRAGHFLGVRFPYSGPPDGLAAKLAAERIHVSVRGSFIRVTPHVYNTDEDINRFFAVLGGFVPNRL